MSVLKELIEKKKVLEGIAGYVVNEDVDDRINMFKMSQAKAARENIKNIEEEYVVKSVESSLLILVGPEQKEDLKKILEDDFGLGVHEYENTAKAITADIPDSILQTGANATTFRMILDRLTTVALDAKYRSIEIPQLRPALWAGLDLGDVKQMYIFANRLIKEAMGVMGPCFINMAKESRSNFQKNYKGALLPVVVTFDDEEDLLEVKELLEKDNICAGFSTLGVLKTLESEHELKEVNADNIEVALKKMKAKIKKNNKEQE